MLFIALLDCGVLALLFRSGRFAVDLVVGRLLLPPFLPMRELSMSWALVPCPLINRCATLELAQLSPLRIMLEPVSYGTVAIRPMTVLESVVRDGCLGLC